MKSFQNSQEQKEQEPEEEEEEQQQESANRRRRNPPAPLRGHQAVGLGLLLPAPVAISSVQCDSSTFCFY